MTKSPYILRQLDLLACAMWAAVEPLDAEDRGELITMAIQRAGPGVPPAVELPPPKVTVKPASIAARAEELGFAEFWSLYPRRTAKQPAMKAWIRLTVAQRKKVLDVLPAFAACPQWKKAGGLYIPHASTFLNQERFNEAPPAGEEKQTKADARADVANQMFKRGTYAEPGIEIDGTVCSRSG